MPFRGHKGRIFTQFYMRYSNFWTCQDWDISVYNCPDTQSKFWLYAKKKIELPRTQIIKVTELSIRRGAPIVQSELSKTSKMLKNAAFPHFVYLSKGRGDNSVKLWIDFVSLYVWKGWEMEKEAKTPPNVPAPVVIVWFSSPLCAWPIWPHAERTSEMLIFFDDAVYFQFIFWDCRAAARVWGWIIGQLCFPEMSRQFFSREMHLADPFPSLKISILERPFISFPADCEKWCTFA